VGLQKVRLDKSGTEPAVDNTAFYGNGNEVNYKKTSVNDSQSPGRDLNQEHPEYDAGVLSIRQRRLVYINGIFSDKVVFICIC
jgi:hypothetical protein